MSEQARFMKLAEDCQGQSPLGNAVAEICRWIAVEEARRAAIFSISDMNFTLFATATNGQEPPSR